MIRWTAVKAIVVGVSVLVLGQVIYVFDLLQVDNYGLLHPMLLGFPALAAFAAAYFSPRRKVAVGMSMAIFGPAIGIASAAAYEHFGLNVDSIGSPLATFVILLGYDSALSLIGSVVGNMLSRGKGPRLEKHTPEQIR